MKTVNKFDKKRAIGVFGASFTGSFVGTVAAQAIAAKMGATAVGVVFSGVAGSVLGAVGGLAILKKVYQIRQDSKDREQFLYALYLKRNTATKNLIKC